MRCADVLKLDAERVRDAIVDGYQDAIARRTVQFNGNPRSLIKKAGKWLARPS